MSETDRKPPFEMGSRVLVAGSNPKLMGRVVGLIPPAHPGRRWIVRVDMDSEFTVFDKWVREFSSNNLEALL
jgi:hypothetical protein